MVMLGRDISLEELKAKKERKKLKELKRGAS